MVAEGLVRVKQADHDDGNEGEHESGDDFIHSPPCALMPDKNRQSTDDNADQSTVAGDAFPQKRKDDDRAEGSTEAAPGVAHQRENQVVRICSNQDCDALTATTDRGRSRRVLSEQRADE